MCIGYALCVQDELTWLIVAWIWIFFAVMGTVPGKAWNAQIRNIEAEIASSDMNGAVNETDGA